MLKTFWLNILKGEDHLRDLAVGGRVLQLSLVDVDWIELAQDRIQWLVPVKVMGGIGCRKLLMKSFFHCGYLEINMSRATNEATLYSALSTMEIFPSQVHVQLLKKLLC
jgi:hypothetical protein